MTQTLELIPSSAGPTQTADPTVLSIANTADPLQTPWASARRIDLHFPKWTDGRALSQAVLLRRAGFAGDLRATGDVVADLVLALQRCGFSSAVLRADQNLATAQRQFQFFSGFYQPDPATLRAPGASTQPTEPLAA